MLVCLWLLPLLFVFVVLCESAVVGVCMCWCVWLVMMLLGVCCFGCAVVVCVC